MTTRIAVILEGTFATPEGITKISENCITALDKVTATNESNATAIATVDLLSPDGSLVQSFDKGIFPGKSWPFPEVVGHTLDVGGSIKVSCPTASAIKFRISGRQFTG